MFDKDSNLLRVCVNSIPNPLATLCLICVSFGSSQAKNMAYFPVDSSDTYVYLQYNRILGSNQSIDSSYQTISKYKQLDDSTISRVITIDSSGGQKTLNDTCKEVSSVIVCKYETLHILGDTTLPLPYRFFATVMGKSFCAFDSNAVSGGPVGGGKREYYQFGIGQIYSSQNRIYGVGESQMEKFLMLKNTVNVGSQLAVDSLRKFRSAGVTKASKAKLAMHNHGILETRTNILGQRCLFSFVEKLRHLE